MSFNTILLPLVCLGCALVLANGHAQTFDASGFPYEVVEPLDTAAPGLQTPGASTDSAFLSLDYLGLRLDIELQPNSGLFAALPRAQRDAIAQRAQVYRGTVAGLPDSWVRLTKTAEGWSGLVHDGTELLVVEPLARTGQPAKPGQLMMYRFADAPMRGDCGTVAEGDAIASLDQLTAELSALAPTLGAALQQLNVATLMDVDYQQSRGDATSHALALFNAVDGIYSEQVGVAIKLSDLDALNSNGPLQSTDPSTLLDQLTAYVRDQPVSNPGVVHLLTGRDLNGSTIGIAYLNALCSSRYGTGLSQITGTNMATQVVLISHELGHNFGAPHDNQTGSACASTPGTFIMNPSLRSTFTEFSNCSLNEMSQEIAGASCLVDITPEPPDPTGSCLFSQSFSDRAGGYDFQPDAQDPAYSTGIVDAGGLNVQLGGRDNALIRNIGGTWAGNCELDQPTAVSVTVQARLTRSGAYEQDESSTIALNLNGDNTNLVQLSGDGAGQDTGLQTYRVDTTLPSGSSRVALGCRNSKKDAANETTACQFSAIEIAPAGGAPGPVLIDADFDDGVDGFEFQADPIAANRFYTRGISSRYGTAGTRALRTALGGQDDRLRTDLSALWVRNFVADGPVQLLLDAKLVQSATYEADETSAAYVQLDGVETELLRLTGDGNAGPMLREGFTRYRLDLNLSAGTHVLALGCSNNRKSRENEFTFCYFDNVRVEQP